jgi:hypothetical protein
MERSDCGDDADERDRFDDFIALLKKADISTSCSLLRNP